MESIIIHSFFKLPMGFVLQHLFYQYLNCYLHSYPVLSLLVFQFYFDLLYLITTLY